MTSQIKLIGKNIFDKSGIAQKLDRNIKTIHNYNNTEDWNNFKKEIDTLEKNPVQVHLYLKTHGLEQVEGLTDYILNNNIKQDHVNELINYTNIANQAHGLSGVRKAIDEYNKGINDSNFNVSEFNKSIFLSNSSLGKYLTSLNGTSAEMFGYAKSLATATIKTFALESAVMILNTTMSFGLSFVITGLISAIDNLIHKQEQEAKALENAKSATQNYKNSLTDIRKETIKTASSANEIAEAYAKLAQGVNTNTNENINLSNDDYEEFLNLNSQLAELFPSLTKGYDENGNAILGLGGNVETVTEKIAGLIEMQKRLAKSKIKENLQKYVEGDDENYGQLKVIEEKKKALESSKEEDEIAYRIAYEIITRYPKGEVHKSDVKLVDKLLNEAGLENGKDYQKTGNFLLGYQYDFSSLRDNEEKLTQFKNVYNNLYADILQTTQNAEAELKTANQEMSAQMMIWVEDLPTYTENGETFQKAISTMINSIEWDKFDITDYEGAKKLIQQSILTPISMVANDPDAKSQMINALSQLFTTDYSKMSVEQAQKVIDGYLTTIMNLMNSKITDESQKKSLSDMYTIFGMEDYQNPVNKLQANLKSISNDNTDEMKKLSDYTKDFTLKQQKVWLNATEGANNATEAIKRYETSLQTTKNTNLIPFKEVWKDTAKETKQELLELAKSGEISEKTLKSTKEYNEILAKTGMTAKRVKNKITNMLTPQEKLSAFSNGMTGLKTAYNEFQDKKFVTATTLESLPIVFKNINGGKDFDLFSQIVGDPTNGKEKIKKAFDDIVTAYLKDQNTLAGVTNKTKNTVIANLKDAGINNAEGLVNSYINTANKIKKALFQAEEELYNKSSSERQTDLENFQKLLSKKDVSFAEACTALGGKNAILMQILGKQYANDYIKWTELLSKKIAAYNTMVAAIKDAGDTDDFSNALYADESAAFKAKYGMSPQEYLDKYDVKNKPISELINESKAMLLNPEKSTGSHNLQNAKILAEARAIINNDKASKAERNFRKNLPVKLNYAEQPDFNGINYDGSSNSKEDKNAEKKSYQFIDWITRKLEILQKQIDLTKAKFENLFALKSQKKNLKKQISQTTKLLNNQEKAAKKYQLIADNYAKKNKINKNVIKKIKNGSLNITKYESDTADIIQTYEDYYDKAKEAKKAAIETKTAIRELKEQRNQLYVDQADSKLSAIDAQAEIAKNSKGEKSAKATNNILQKKVAWTKQYYKYQIKNAKLEKDATKIAELRAQKEKALLDIKIQQEQNLADERESHYNLNQQRAENATDAKTKNKYETDSLKNKQDQYKHLQNIAKLEYGEKSAEYKLLLEEEKAAVNESYKKMYDNIKEEYDNLTGLNDAKISTTQAEIATLEAAGKSVSKEMYEGMMKLTSDKKEKLLEELAELEETGKNFEYGSDEWYAWQNDLEATKQGLYDCTQQSIELQKKVNDLDFKKFALVAAQLDATKSHFDFLVDMLSHQDLTSKDAGGLTDAGMAAISLRFANMENNAKIRENAQAELAKLHEDHINGKDFRTEEEYLAYEKELTDTIRDTITADADEKDAILDLVDNAMQVQIDAIDELIEKKKKALETEKDLYEYQKKVAKQTKNIALIQKQIAALSGDHSEEARAKLQKLQVSLEDAQEELRDTEYDRWYDDQTDMLDSLADEVKNFWEKIMSDLRKDMNGSMDNLLQMVTENPEAVARALDTLGLGDALSIITTYNPDGTHTDKVIDYGGNSYESTYDETGTNVKNKSDTSINDVSSATDDLSYEVKRVTGATSDLNKILQGEMDSFNERVEKSHDNLIQAVQDGASSEQTPTDTTANTATAGKGILSENNRAGKNAEIDSFLKKNLRKPKNTEESMRIATDELLQYLDKKYNKKGYLTKAKEAELAEMLGISLKNKKNITYDESVKLRDALKNAGFSQGGVASTLNKAAKDNGDDGLITLKRGESVLTREQTDAVQNLADTLVPAGSKITEEQEHILMEHLGIPLDYTNIVPKIGNVPINNTTNASVSVGDVNIHMDGSNVTDPESFCNTLNHSLNMQGAIKRCVAADMAKPYSNTLGRF